MLFVMLSSLVSVQFILTQERSGDGRRQYLIMVISHGHHIKKQLVSLHGAYFPRL